MPRVKYWQDTGMQTSEGEFSAYQDRWRVLPGGVSIPVKNSTETMILGAGTYFYIDAIDGCWLVVVRFYTSDGKPAEVVQCYIKTTYQEARDELQRFSGGKPITILTEVNSGARASSFQIGDHCRAFMMYCTFDGTTRALSVGAQMGTIVELASFSKT